MSLDYALFVKSKNIGWVGGSDGQVAGTFGRSFKTDAFRISGCPVPLEFRIHVEGEGWRDWVAQGGYDSGVGKRLEAIQFRFPRGKKQQQILVGRAHVEGHGWSRLTLIENNNFLGTTGQSRRLEAVQLDWFDHPDLTDHRKVLTTLHRIHDIQIPLWDGRQSMVSVEKKLTKQQQEWFDNRTWDASPGGSGIPSRVLDLVIRWIEASAKNPPDGKNSTNENGEVNHLEGFDVTRAERLVPDNGAGDLPGGDPSKIIG